MGNVCTSQSYFLQDIHQLFLVHQQVFFPQMHIVTSAGLLQHSWGIGSLTFKTKRFNYFFPEISFLQLAFAPSLEKAGVLVGMAELEGFVGFQMKA